jgi:hypothetical protein
VGRLRPPLRRRHRRLVGGDRRRGRGGGGAGAAARGGGGAAARADVRDAAAAGRRRRAVPQAQKGKGFQPRPGKLFYNKAGGKNQEERAESGATSRKRGRDAHDDDQDGPTTQQLQAELKKVKAQLAEYQKPVTDQKSTAFAGIAVQEDSDSDTEDRVFAAIPIPPVQGKKGKQREWVKLTGEEVRARAFAAMTMDP